MCFWSPILPNRYNCNGMGFPGICKKLQIKVAGNCSSAHTVLFQFKKILYRSHFRPFQTVLDTLRLLQSNLPPVNYYFRKNCKVILETLKSEQKEKNSKSNRNPTYSPPELSLIKYSIFIYPYLSTVC